MINRDLETNVTYGHPEVVHDVFYGKPYPINAQSEQPPWLKERVDITTERPSPPPKEALKQSTRKRMKLRRPKNDDASNKVPVENSAKQNECVAPNLDHTMPQENEEGANNADKVDEEYDTESDDGLETGGTYIPKPRVEPTQQKIYDKVLEHNKFENQMLVHDGVHIISRGMLYRSFKKNGEIDMEVMCAWCSLLNSQLADMNIFTTYVIKPTYWDDLFRLGIKEVKYVELVTAMANDIKSDIEKGVIVDEVQKFYKKNDRATRKYILGRLVCSDNNTIKVKEILDLLGIRKVHSL
ncbi:uncharacterized protein [Spinacia oleracea]|uniref:Uncharacterized protein n=1 Tax=Spinacia oleracea TaxID=3562 RepID=A0ABM3RAU2_SPIOL|nr:uncharacterized protein LOC110803383 [Spinacia oleracea]XP_056692738.1 uncharacterized protein LOC110803383 [Spinacia oleracea]XP_056692739.1 uncharacterized protein LOC110803383 [Spinacia oleracea]XP_056692740.1 uncharacterized protein LOC110803383 [Spinacia oleracea]